MSSAACAPTIRSRKPQTGFVRGENIAARYVRSTLGYKLLTRNFQIEGGEVDIIARDGKTLVFIEVKTRRGRGSPWDALGAEKQGRVRRMAISYLSETDRPTSANLRFDAIGIVFDARGRLVSLEHLEGAF